jgi:hypothetical protein
MSPTVTLRRQRWLTLRRHFFTIQTTLFFVPIFKVPTSKIFLFCHYYPFCTRTIIQCLINERLVTVMSECDLEGIGVPSIFKSIRKVVSLTRMFPTLTWRYEITPYSGVESWVYHETIKRELNKRRLYECRCHEGISGRTIFVYFRQKKNIIFEKAHALQCPMPNQVRDSMTKTGRN